MIEGAIAAGTAGGDPLGPAAHLLGLCHRITRTALPPALVAAGVEPPVVAPAPVAASAGSAGSASAAASASTGASASAGAGAGASAVAGVTGGGAGVDVDGPLLGHIASCCAALAKQLPPAALPDDLVDLLADSIAVLPPRCATRVVDAVVRGDRGSGRLSDRLRCVAVWSGCPPRVCCCRRPVLVPCWVNQVCVCKLGSGHQ